MKEIKFQPGCLNEVITRECKNLRLQDGELRVVGTTKYVCSGDYHPLAAVTTDSGRMSIIASTPGGEIAIIDEVDGTKIIVGTMADSCEPTCALCLGNKVWLMPSGTSDKPQKLTYDPDSEAWTWHDEPQELEPLGIVAENCSLISQVIEAQSLKGSYNSRSSQLSNEDAQMLTGQLIKAYYNLVDEAAARRCYVQPVLAWFRIISNKGHVIHESCPRLVSAESGVQLPGMDVNFTLSGTSAQAGAGVMAAHAFRPRLVMPATLSDNWNSQVGGVELMVTPQIHPLVPELQVTGRIADDTLSLTLPGFAQPVAGEGTEYRARILAMLCSAKKLATACDGYNGRWADARTQVTEIKKLVSQPVTNRQNSLSSYISSPHHFTARAVAQSGDKIVWGGLQAHMFQGYSVREMAATQSATGTQPWAACVEMADGQRIVRSGVERGNISLRLSPLIVYPHAGAKKIEIIINDNKITLPLTPTPDGKMAYYLQPECRSFVPDQGMDAFVIPAGGKSVKEMPEAVCISDISEPLMAMKVVNAGVGEVRCVMPAVRSQSSWDFSRSHFYVMGTGGIAAMKVNLTGVQLATMTSHAVYRPEQVTLIPQAVAVASHGELLLLKGNTVKPIAQIIGMDKIGWNGTFEELWCVDSRGNVLILNDKGEILSHRTEKITCIKSLNSHLWLTDDAGILRDASCEVSAEMACEWQGRIRLPIPAREVIWELLGRAKQLQVKIEGDRGADASQTIANYAITGLINRPMRMLLHGPARRYLTLSVTGTMITGGRLGEIRLKI